MLGALQEVESSLAGYLASDRNRRALDALVDTELALAEAEVTRGYVALNKALGG